MKIQQVEKQTGIPAQSIRFYEREGLILPERNPENRYRTYGPEDVERLETIAFCRKLGVPISAIRKLLSGQVGFRECVEGALLDARAAEQEARVMAELCQTVLRQLETCPDLTPQECTQVLLGAPHVRYLYDQVVPKEHRKANRKFEYYHAAYILGTLTVMMGLFCACLIGYVAAVRSARANLHEWVGNPQNTMTLVYEGEAYPVTLNTELDRMVGYMLILGQPTQFVPGLRPCSDIVVLQIDGPEGRGELCLYLQQDTVGMVWQSPEDRFKATLVQHQAWVQLSSILRLLKQG